MQTTLLNSTQHNAVKDAVEGTCPIFDLSTDTNLNMVSKCELDAYNHAVTNYMNWAEKVQCLSSFLKDGWFTGALVAPPMLEVVRDSETLTQKYQFNRYVP